MNIKKRLLYDLVKKQVEKDLERSYATEPETFNDLWRDNVNYIRYRRGPDPYDFNIDEFFDKNKKLIFIDHPRYYAQDVLNDLPLPYEFRYYFLNLGISKSDSFKPFNRKFLCPILEEIFNVPHRKNLNDG